MRTNKIIQQIETDVENLSKIMDLDDAISLAVKKYEKDIIARFKDAKKSLMFVTGIKNDFGVKKYPADNLFIHCKYNLL